MSSSDPPDVGGRGVDDLTRARAEFLFFFLFYIIYSCVEEWKCCKMYILRIYIFFIRQINDSRMLISEMYLSMYILY